MATDYDGFEMEPPHPACDTSFRSAVYAAANGHTEPLAKQIRSGCDLGAGERELLATYIEGGLRKIANRPPFGPGTPHVANAVAAYREKKVLHGEESAASEVSAAIGRSKSTIREWDRQTREREAEIEKHGKLPKK